MILVTGATGNVGRELVSTLLARGERVRALTRRPDAAGLPAAAEVVPGSTSDTTALTTALSDVDGVFLNPLGDVGPVVAASSHCDPTSSCPTRCGGAR